MLHPGPQSPLPHFAPLTRLLLLDLSRFRRVFLQIFGGWSQTNNNFGGQVLAKIASKHSIPCQQPCFRTVALPVCCVAKTTIAIVNSSSKIVAAESNNFGILLSESLTALTTDEIEKKQLNKLKNFYYEFFISKGGSASFTGSGSSIKKSATDSTNLGISYKIYGCGIYGGEDRMVVALESSVVLPRQ